MNTDYVDKEVYYRLLGNSADDRKRNRNMREFYHPGIFTVMKRVLSYIIVFAAGFLAGVAYLTWRVMY